MPTFVEIPHAHLGVSGRVMNVGGGQAFRSGMNMGGTIQGLSSNLGTSGNRNYVPGNPALGPRITNIVSRSNIGINISSGGLSVPIISSHIDFRVNAASGRLNVQGSNRMMHGLILQGMPDGAIGLMLMLIYFPKLLQSGMQIYFRELLPKTNPLLFFAPMGQEMRAILFTGCSLDRFFLWILWLTDVLSLWIGKKT
ncbi:unnamed protein product [Triticum turgidum subsp. durum]|uniref:Uncharacterized protein n=1 Tax=Triticum turgidum subsp. durum TaxID=4567 RepID=A0A9R0TKG2_TRITD|nr:unnamed protein product [Triticum turgidum subsp. durum]